MGKKAKGFRHLEKMKQKKADKARKAAAYAAMAGTGNNSKRKSGSASGKAHLRTRNPLCANIGDLVSHPEMITSAMRLYRNRQYKGKFKGMLRDLTKPKIA